MKKICLTVMLLSVGLISACGQKGALYLPSEPQTLPELHETVSRSDDGNY